MEKMIGREIKMVHHILSRRFHKYTKKYIGEDATIMHTWIIGFIAKNGDKEVFQKDIEKEFQLAKSTTTSILKLMEKKELITRRSVAYDDRLKQLSLTDKGLEIASAVWDNIKESEKLLVRGIPEDKLETFYEVLDQVCKNAENQI